jgi:repressor LexA
MSASDLNPKEFKAFFLVRDGLRYRGQVPTLQAISDHVGFKTRRAASLVLERLVKKGYLGRAANGFLRVLKEPTEQTPTERTVQVPLVGSVPCGIPLLAEENVEALIPVSQRIIRPGATYFLLRANGNSMDEAGISDGDLIIVRQQPVAEDGDRVVALIDDEATVKELRLRGGPVMLLPRSSDKGHKPIIMDRDFLIQGVVIGTLPSPDWAATRDGRD